MVAFSSAPRGGKSNADLHKTSYFFLGQVAALQNRRDDSLAWIRQAIRAGYDDVDALTTHPDLALLQGDPELEALIADLSKKSD